LLALLSLLFLAALAHVSLCEEITTGDIVQISLKIGTVKMLKTIIISNGTYTLRLCGLKADTEVNIALPSYSSYGVSSILYVDMTGREKPLVVDRYTPDNVTFRVPQDALCVLVYISRKPTSAELVPVGNITLRYEVVNSNVTISSNVVPSTAVFGNKIAKLLYVDVCFLSLAPVRLRVRNLTYAVFIRNDTQVIDGYLLYRQCIRTYMLPLVVKVEGAATMQITAYYGVKLGKRAERLSKTVTVRLSPSLVAACSNVQLCNYTMCGREVRAHIGDTLLVSLSGVIVAKVRLDSTFNDTLTLRLPELIPLRTVKLVDRYGHLLNNSKITVILRGFITTELRDDVCVPAGFYTVMFKLYNRTYTLGREYIDRGSVIELPLRAYPVRYSEQMSNYTVIFQVKDVKLVNPHVVILPPDLNLSDVKVLVKVGRDLIETWFEVKNNTIVVSPCVAKVKFTVSDMLGFPVENVKISLAHGEYRYVCSLGSFCLVPCGSYVMYVQVGGSIIKEEKITIHRGIKHITVTLSMLSRRSLELVMYFIAIACVIATVSVAGRFARRGKEESEIIEIQ